jgi:hypothetical protein
VSCGRGWGGELKARGPVEQGTCGAVQWNIIRPAANGCIEWACCMVLKQTSWCACKHASFTLAAPCLFSWSQHQQLAYDPLPAVNAGVLEVPLAVDDDVVTRTLQEVLMGGKARQGKARQGKARQGKARQGKARQGKARQGKARQGKARQGKARQGKARQGKARQGKARQGKAEGAVWPCKLYACGGGCTWASR